MMDAELDLQPDVVYLVNLQPLTADAFAPFGSVVEAPVQAGARAFYTKWLGSARAEMAPRLHTNHVAVSALPITIHMLEQHPYSAQIFMPLDVARYVVVVAPTNDLGLPDLAMVQAFIASGNVGVVYGPGVWHAGASVLDRAGSFAVLAWRNETADDEVFYHLDASLQVQL